MQDYRLPRPDRCGKHPHCEYFALPFGIHQRILHLRRHIRP